MEPHLKSLDGFQTYAVSLQVRPFFNIVCGTNKAPRQIIKHH